MPKRRNRLTPLQDRFVAEYIIDLKPAQAAIRAGVKPTNAPSQAHKWLMKEHVGQALAKAQEARSKRTEVTADAVVERLRQIVFTNITSIVSWDGNTLTLRNSSEIPMDNIGAIQEVTQTKDGLLRIRLRDIIGAATLLARHTGVIPTPGTTKDPLQVDLTLHEDELDLAKFTEEELQQYHDIIGALIEAQAITQPAENPG